MNVPLTEEESATYEWQMWVQGFGIEGQKKLKQATALVSRVGGLGSPVSGKQSGRPLDLRLF